MVRPFWLILGLLSLLIGFVGIFLPVLPTIPFAIFSAFCFERGSPRLHQWILRQPIVGPAIIDWKQNRVIPLRIKWLVLILASSGLVFPLSRPFIPIWVKIGMTGLVLWIIGFVWLQKSKPSPPSSKV